MMINAETFFADSPIPGTFGRDGTVEVTIRNETRRVKATKYHSGDLIARGLTGRYQTGSKAWPATITQRITPAGHVFEFVSFGRDDRSGKFRKENCIHFA